MTGGGYGSGQGGQEEADRWLATSEKLLASGDLQGAKTFAIRACETDPTRAEDVDYIIAVCDTLVAGESRIGNTNLRDWYGVLRLAQRPHGPELVATQYRRLALLLNPQVNRLPFADQAFRLVSDAWYILSDPSKKASYDRELQLSQLGHIGFEPYNQVQQESNQQFHQFPQPQLQTKNENHDGKQQAEQINGQSLEQYQPRPTITTRRTLEEQRVNLNNATESSRQTRSSVPAHTSWHAQPTHPSRQSEAVPHVVRTCHSVEQVPTTSNVESTRASQAEPSSESSVSSFWTACPYCYTLFEYSKQYEECILRCQSCRRAFQAVTIQSPPATGKNAYFCSWSFFPLGFMGTIKPTGWSPISPMFPCPIEQVEQHGNKDTDTKSAAPKFYFDDDDVYVDIFDESEDDYDDDNDNKDDDEDWMESEIRKKKKAKQGQSKESAASSKKRQTETLGLTGQTSGSAQESVEVLSSSGLTSVLGNRKKIGTGAKNLGKLDLNVEFSNEVEETAVALGRNQESGLNNKVEDNIEGNSFFEGLDEFLSSLPILSVVPDDKVKAT